MAETRTVEKYYTIGIGKFRGNRCCIIAQIPTGPMDKNKIWTAPITSTWTRFTFASKISPTGGRFFQSVLRANGQKNVAKTAIVPSIERNSITNCLYVKRCLLVNFIDPISKKKMRMTAPQVLR